MDAQVENAINIAINPPSDLNLHSQAINFLQQLRTEPLGWQVCLPLAIREPKASDIVRHVSLDIVNHSITSQHNDTQGLLYIKDCLLAYFRKSCIEEQQPDTANIQNKLVQTLTYLFASSYANTWTNFVDDIRSLAGGSSPSNPPSVLGTRIYLKVLISIHDEIADVLVSRTSGERSRDTTLKDLLRERDAPKIAQSWQEILLGWKGKEDTIVAACLTCVGKWASWTDLSLIINETMVSLLFELLGGPLPTGRIEIAAPLQETALNTIQEIAGKKMKPADKLQVMQILKVEEIVAQLINGPTLNDLRTTSNYDTDLVELVAKLVSNTVLDLIGILDSTTDGDIVTIANPIFKQFIPHVLRFFSDEYDEICSTVIPCLTELLMFFRKNFAADTDYHTALPPILQAIVAKMRYDETSTWGDEDDQTDEAEFQELRKRLQVLQQSIAVADEPLYIDTISTIVGTTFEGLRQNQQGLNWRDIDLALHEMYLFGELAVKNGPIYSKTKPPTPAAERLVGMMYKLVEIDVSKLSHPAIQLQYIEICVRYVVFFEHNAQFIPRVLENFVRFMHHEHLKVRRRSWYLFQRFVKHLRQQLGNVAETIVESLRDLLPIHAELPKETQVADDVSSDGSVETSDTTFEAQLYLYESIGCVCSSHSLPAESQAALIQSIMNPLFADLEAHLGPARSGDERALLQVNHLILALGTLAHGFSEWTPATKPSATVAPATVVSEAFGRTAEAILVALESLNSSSIIRGAARSAFSRLMRVLGNVIQPQLPRWINGLLSATAQKEEISMFLDSINQVVYSFKMEVYDVLNTLITPLLQRVYTGLSQPCYGTDDEIQLTGLKRAYLNFLLVVVGNDLRATLISTTNQPAFDSLIRTLEHFIKDPKGLSDAKLALAVLTRMCLAWGGPDLIPEDLTSSPQPALPGFDQFMIERFSPLCWALPGNPAFDPKDAQAKQVLAEAAALQKAILSKTGHGYVSWLRDVELRGMGMGEETINEYVHTIKGADLKGFRGYFQALVQRSKR